MKTLEKPIGLVITYPMHLMKQHGGYRRFREAMQSLNDNEGECWLQRCRNKPKHEVLYVYITVGGKIRFKVNCAGWDAGTATEITRPDGTIGTIEWPRLILTGPVIEAPFTVPYKGFQGFRYTTEIFF